MKSALDATGRAEIATWEAVGVGTRGEQRQYSDLAIETALTLRLIFHLPLRQTEGFLTSIFGMLGCRRALFGINTRCVRLSE